MVLSCAAYGCTNHNKMENKPRFFRFPNNNLELRQKNGSKPARELTKMGLHGILKDLMSIYVENISLQVSQFCLNS